MPSLPVAFVTGAGRGIGASIALRLGRAGAPVIVAARSQEACTDIANAILERGGAAWPVYLDVSDPESIASAVAQAREESCLHGPIGILVNNAGIAETAPFLRHGRETGVDLYEKHLRVNFHGPRRLCEALVPDMVERKRGAIVHVASSAGLQGYPYAAAYVASKHALVGYARCASAELAKTGVSMSLVCPHYVDSPMTDETVARIVRKTGKSEAETRAFLASQNPGGALISADEVAESVATLVQQGDNGVLLELLGGGKSERRVL